MGQGPEQRSLGAHKRDLVLDIKPQPMDVGLPQSVQESVFKPALWALAVWQGTAALVLLPRAPAQQVLPELLQPVDTPRLPVLVLLQPLVLVLAPTSAQQPQGELHHVLVPVQRQPQSVLHSPEWLSPP
jgi:hypothetical protein